VLTIPIIIAHGRLKSARTLALAEDRVLARRGAALCMEARRGRDWVPKFGPVLEIVSVTLVDGAPAAIADGLKAQLVNAGKPVHPKFTAELKVAPPVGAAENV
jgi:hypothetical protein